MPAMPNRWKPNVTVAALIEREGRFLLVEEETSDGLKLNNPAGHLDPGESPEQACAHKGCSKRCGSPCPAKWGSTAMSCRYSVSGAVPTGGSKSPCSGVTLPSTDW